MIPRLRVQRWAWLTIGLYAISLIALTLPLLLSAFLDRQDLNDLHQAFGEWSQVYGLWGYWVLIGTLTLAEALFLLVPIQLARVRPVPRRHWIATATAAAFMMALLIAGGAFAVGEAIRGSKFGESGEGWAVLGLGVAGWIFWGVVFARRGGDDPFARSRGLVDTLLAGSVAELLVAVPCHIWVRRKDYCCAGELTFLGLATGLATMLFAFGPAVLFLFVRRIKRLRAATTSSEAPSAHAGRGASGSAP